jgi:hypothetical protein
MAGRENDIIAARRKAPGLDQQRPVGSDSLALMRKA